MDGCSSLDGACTRADCVIVSVFAQYLAHGNIFLLCSENANYSFPLLILDTALGIPKIVFVTFSAKFVGKLNLVNSLTCWTKQILGTIAKNWWNQTRFFVCVGCVNALLKNHLNNRFRWCVVLRSRRDTTFVQTMCPDLRLFGKHVCVEKGFGGDFVHYVVAVRSPWMGTSILESKLFGIKLCKANSV